MKLNWALINIYVSTQTQKYVWFEMVHYIKKRKEVNRTLICYLLQLILCKEKNNNNNAAASIESTERKMMHDKAHHLKRDRRFSSVPSFSHIRYWCYSSAYVYASVLNITTQSAKSLCIGMSATSRERARKLSSSVVWWFSN